MELDVLKGRLAAWSREGLLTEEQAARILERESDRRAVDLPPPTGAPVDRAARRPAHGTDRRARVAEVVGYVGAAFALGAIGLLVAEFWPDLVAWARVALAAVLTTVALGAGVLLRGRGADSDAIDRLVGALWAVGIAGVAWTTGIVAWDVVGVDERWMPTVVAGVAALVAAILLLLGRHVLVQLAAFVALGSAVAGTLVAVAPLEPGALAFGVLITGGAAAWGLAGAGGWLGPRTSAEVTGAVFALIGAQVLTATGWPRIALAFGILLALILALLSMPGGRLHLLYIGAFGLFVNVPRLVVELFADTLGAPATLLTVGVLLILMAVGLGRLRSSQEVGHA